MKLNKLKLKLGFLETLKPKVDKISNIEKQTKEKTQCIKMN